MKILLIVTPTPGFEGDSGRVELVQCDLEKKLVGPLSAEFMSATFQAEVEAFLPKVDCSIIYFHQSWLTKPRHMTTMAGFDLLELLEKGSKPYVVLYPQNASTSHPRLQESRYNVPLDKSYAENLIATIRSAMSGEQES